MSRKQVLCLRCKNPVSYITVGEVDWQVYAICKSCETETNSLIKELEEAKQSILRGVDYMSELQVKNNLLTKERDESKSEVEQLTNENMHLKEHVEQAKSFHKVLSKMLGINHKCEKKIPPPPKPTR